jgi:hypothetical protein
MKTATDPQEFLNTFTEQLETIGGEASRQAQDYASKIQEHERIVAQFKADGTGNIAEVERSQSSLDALDKLLFHPGQRPTAALAGQERQMWLASHAANQAATAREKYVRDNSRDLADALEALIQEKSQTRAAWREDKVEEMLACDRRIRLEENLTEHDARVLRAKANTVDVEISAHDTIHREAIRYAAKLRVSPSVEVFETAHAFAQQISYEL